MKLQHGICLLAALMMVGCVTTTKVPPAPSAPPAPPNLSQALEGTKYKIWKEASYVGIRSELQDGETIIFKNVEVKFDSSSNDYYYLGNIYSLDGHLLFDKKYTLNDVGVIEMKWNINKEVNNDVIKATRGVRYHGDAVIKNSFSQTYWKTTGGNEPTATAVSNYISSFGNEVAKTKKNGVRMRCFTGNIYISFDNRKIYAATGEDITVTVYSPYSKKKDYQSQAIGNTGVSLKVDKYIDRILLEDDAIKLRAFSHANQKFASVTAYNNGLTEAYTRVKNNCSL